MENITFGPFLFPLKLVLGILPSKESIVDDSKALLLIQKKQMSKALP